MLVVAAGAVAVAGGDLVVVPVACTVAVAGIEAAVLGAAKYKFNLKLTINKKLNKD